MYEKIIESIIQTDYQDDPILLRRTYFDARQTIGQLNWANDIGEELRARLTPHEMAYGCSVSQMYRSIPALKGFHSQDSTSKKWYDAPPAFRRTVISLGILLGWNKDDISDMLKLSGFSDFYPKSPEDAIWLYIIHHWKTLKLDGNTPADVYAYYYCCFLEAAKAEDNNSSAKDTLVVARELNRFLQHGNTDFEDWLHEYIHSFQAAHVRLANQLDALLKEYGVVQSRTQIPSASLANWINKFFSQVKKRQAFQPLPRERLIALTLSLGIMNCSKINHVLAYADMYPLQFGDESEGILILLLEHLNGRLPSNYYYLYAIANRPCCRPPFGIDTAYLSEFVGQFYNNINIISPFQKYLE